MCGECFLSVSEKTKFAGTLADQYELERSLNAQSEADFRESGTAARKSWFELTSLSLTVLFAYFLIKFFSAVFFLFELP